MSKDIIRCTLVAGKPVFGRNIFLYHNLNTLSKKLNTIKII